MKKKKITQDDSRERLVCEHLGLIRAEDCKQAQTKKREGIDAFDCLLNPFEIKTSTRDDCYSTARDVTIEKIVEKWQTMYWIFGQGPNLEDRWDMNQLFILHPADLAGQFDPLINKLKTSLTKIDRWTVAMKVGGISDHEIQLAYGMLAKGCSLNDPPISAKYIRRHGEYLHPYDKDKARSSLSEYVTKRPLANMTSIQQTSYDIFANL